MHLFTKSIDINLICITIMAIEGGVTQIVVDMAEEREVVTLAVVDMAEERGVVTLAVVDMAEE